MEPKFENILTKQVELVPKFVDSIDYARLLAERMQKNGINDAFAVMNLNNVVKRYIEWTELMGRRVKPFYAVKCNNDQVLLELLARLGCGFDVASRSELTQVHKLIPPEKVIYANPSKSPLYIEYALQNGVRKMTFDTAEELQKVHAISGGEAELVLRIRSDDPEASCPLGSKFGCDFVEEAPYLLQLASDLNQKVVGISFHVGSGCNNPASFRAAIQKAHHLFEIGRELGHPMRLLDIGGGFPGSAQSDRLFHEIASVVTEALNDYFPDPTVEVIAEPGRYFATTSMSICPNVVSAVHVHPGRHVNENEPEFLYYLNDSLYGSFNCIIFDHQNPHGQLLFGAENRDEHISTVFGQTCDSIDIIEQNVMMPQLVEGEWLYYENLGAYTLVAGSTFNGFPLTHTYYFIDEEIWNLLHSTH